MRCISYGTNETWKYCACKIIISLLKCKIYTVIKVKFYWHVFFLFIVFLFQVHKPEQRWLEFSLRISLMLKTLTQMGRSLTEVCQMSLSKKSRIARYNILMLEMLAHSLFSIQIFKYIYTYVDFNSLLDSCLSEFRIKNALLFTFSHYRVSIVLQFKTSS